jgi:glycerol-3-phosphate cytidylyltransferase
MVIKNNKIIIGYTSGVFDLFHVGHLNILKNAKSMCDKLIVGVTTDELVSYKHKKSVIPFSERIQIVSACRSVDLAIAQDKIDKFEMHQRLKFDILFVGDDWYNDDNWKNYEKKLSEYSVKIIYFPYTKGTSSTLINQTLENLRNK